MDLTVGTRLGVYTVTSLIGKGGMGEVYRARDARLGRDVAIKVLPQKFAHDPERMARFEREASGPEMPALRKVFARRQSWAKTKSELSKGFERRESRMGRRLRGSTGK